MWHVRAGLRYDALTMPAARRARLNLLERVVGVEDDTVEDDALRLHSA